MKKKKNNSKKFIWIFGSWFILGSIISFLSLFWLLQYESNGILVIPVFVVLIIFVLAITIPLALVSIKTKSESVSQILKVIVIIILSVHLLYLLSLFSESFNTHNLAMGIRTNNPEYCQEILSSDSKNSCLGILNSDPALCDKINNLNLRDICYINIAKETNNSLICEKVSSVKNLSYNPGYDSREACLSDIAKSTLNYSICDMIGNDTHGENDFCYARISAIMLK